MCAVCVACAVPSDGFKLHVSSWFLSTLVLILLTVETALVPDLEISGRVQITDLHNSLRKFIIVMLQNPLTCCLPQVTVSDHKFVCYLQRDK